jgi:hypothetical protein
MWPSISQLRRRTRAGRPAGWRRLGWRRGDRGDGGRSHQRFGPAASPGGAGSPAAVGGARWLGNLACLARGGRAKESSEVRRSQKRKMKRPVGRADSLLYYLTHCGARVRSNWRCAAGIKVVSVSRGSLTLLEMGRCGGL